MMAGEYLNPMECGFKPVTEPEIKEQFYLFRFDDDSVYEMTCGISFKDALWEMSKYTGYSSEMLLKALKGYDSNDVDGICALFEALTCAPRIRAVYIVEKKIYDIDTK